MIKTVLQKVVPVLLLTYLISYFLLVGFYLIFPPALVLPSMQINYIFRMSLLSFIEYLIPINCTGLLIAYSLFLTENDMLSKKGSAHPFHRAVTPILTLLLVFAVVYAILITWVYALTLRTVDATLDNTRIVHSYHLEAEKLRKEGQHREAMNLLNASLIIDPDNKKGHELRDTLQSYMVENNLYVEEKETIEPTPLPAEDLAVPDLFKKAQNFFYKEDWYSAYYYATLAFKLDPRYADAEDLARRAMERINTFDLSIADQNQQNFLLEKQKGFQALSNNDYLAAYYIFVNLKKANPADTTLDAYLAKAAAQLKTSTFFYEDCLLPLSLPGVENILFINENSTTQKEFVFIGKMVNYNSQYFFKDIEVIGFTATGKITLHFKTTYGKYYYADLPATTTAKGEKSGSAHHILMNCISKEEKNVSYTPEYAVDPANIKSTHIYRLAADPAWFSWLTVHPNKYRSMGINTLFDIKQYLTRFGYREDEVNIEIISRLSQPFLFLIFAVFAISLGWLYRSRYDRRPPVPVVLLIPLFPVIVGIIYRMLIYVNRLFTIFSINVFGYFLSFITGGIVLGVLLIIAILTVAGQVSK